MESAKIVYGSKYSISAHLRFLHGALQLSSPRKAIGLLDVKQ